MTALNKKELCMCRKTIFGTYKLE